MSFDGDDHQPAPPLDLLDEYWFFSNTLNKNKNKKGNKKPPLLPPKSPSTTKPKPSLPPPRMPRTYGRQEDDEEGPVKEQEAEEVDDDDLNWSSIYEGVLRTRMAAGQQGSSSSSLQRAPSMPVVPSSSDRRKEKETPSMPIGSNNKLRHSYSTLERHCRRSNNYKKQQLAEQKKTARSSSSSSSSSKPPTMMVRSKSALFDKKKWKSSSDLESIEVQGFKDLGFVFDKEELRENLADVLPGLKNAASTDDDHASVRRPYLSEAWRHDRRPPALIRVQSSEARSAAEMKDQLRMWAQAVACNVRQECV